MSAKCDPEHIQNNSDLIKYCYVEFDSWSIFVSQVRSLRPSKGGRVAACAYSAHVGLGSVWRHAARGRRYVGDWLGPGAAR